MGLAFKLLKISCLFVFLQSIHAGEFVSGVEREPAAEATMILRLESGA